MSADAPFKYEMTAKGAMKWASHELKHVGYIAGIKSPEIQYMYALSTVNGMMHLRDALYELVKETEMPDHKRDLLRTHDKVVRVIKHLVAEYKLDVSPIKAFDVKGVLSAVAMSNVQGGGARRRRRGTRRSSRKSQKSSRGTRRA